MNISTNSGYYFRAGDRSRPITIRNSRRYRRAAVGIYQPFVLEGSARSKQFQWEDYILRASQNSGGKSFRFRWETSGKL